MEIMEFHCLHCLHCRETDSFRTRKGQQLMGKRSNFEHIPRDFYPTPFAAVPPLIAHLRGVRTFTEPCCGNGALIWNLSACAAPMLATSRPAKTHSRSTRMARPTRSLPIRPMSAKPCTPWSRTSRASCRHGCYWKRTGPPPSRPRASCRHVPTSCQLAACAGSKERP
jgi:hypothetical protein